MKQNAKKKTDSTPYAQITMSYETLGGSGYCKYLFPIRVGKIPFSEMECIALDCLPPSGDFEIIEVTADAFSFVVDREFLCAAEPEIHTIPIRNGIGIYQRSEIRTETIEGDRFNYEWNKRLELTTSERHLVVQCIVSKDGGEDRFWTAVPYAPGDHKICGRYPFSDNARTSPDGSYSFDRIYIGEDLGIRYLDEEVPVYFTEEMAMKSVSHEYTRKFDDEEITINIYLNSSVNHLK